MGRFYPMLMTAAGTIPPAKVLVLGVGVAGLQALATAKRLGAQTTGYDVRPEVAEQVASLGAQWLDLGIEASGEGGYARELTERGARPPAAGADRCDQGLRRGHHDRARARAPGAEARDRRGRGGHEAGIGDRRPRRRGGRQLRADRAGRDGRRHDVKIVSPLNLPATMAEHASQLFARNVQALLELFVGEDGELPLDFDDEIVNGACIVRDGEIVNRRGGRSAARVGGSA